MAVPVLTLNSLLPSQSLFNEIQSIHDTGFFHELDSFLCCKDGLSVTAPTQVRICLATNYLYFGDLVGQYYILLLSTRSSKKGAYTHNSLRCKRTSTELLFNYWPMVDVG